MATKTTEMKYKEIHLTKPTRVNYCSRHFALNLWNGKLQNEMGTKLLIMEPDNTITIYAADPIIKIYKIKKKKKMKKLL